MAGYVELTVSIDRQELTARRVDGGEDRFAISTAAAGAGNVSDSLKTPLGEHEIRARIGAGAPVNAVFSGRRATGELWTPAASRAAPQRDWILTRILWLTGRESGINRGSGVDTLSRYIYLHGTPDDTRLGTPGSHGCIRMRNADIVSLFDRVAVGMRVKVDA
ncbi:MAG: L,D-transpeptidase [Pseudomonadota bacterium]